MAAVGQVAEEGEGDPLINRGLAAKNITVGLPMSGCVISKEDHRYLVSAGISGTHFFLSNKAIPKAKGELTVGQPIEGCAPYCAHGCAQSSLKGGL